MACSAGTLLVTGSSSSFPSSWYKYHHCHCHDIFGCDEGHRQIPTMHCNIEYDHDEWPTASILRTVPSIQYKLSLFQWNLYIIELPRIVFGGNSTKIWNSARLIKLPIGFLRTVATTNSEEFCRNSRNRLWEQIFQRILFENFTSFLTRKCFLSRAVH